MIVKLFFGAQEHSTISSPPVEKVDLHPYTSTTTSTTPSSPLPTISIPLLPTTPTPTTLHHQSPQPPPPTTDPVVIPVRPVSDDAPPTSIGGDRLREDGDGDGEREGEGEMEEPVVSKKKKVQKQISSTIEQVW